MDLRSKICRAARVVDGRARADGAALRAIVAAHGARAVEAELREMAESLADVVHVAAKSLDLPRVVGLAERILSCSGAYAYKP